MSSNRRINTAYTLRNNTFLIKGGEMYFRTMCEMILNAKNSIQLQVYIFEGDQTGKNIANRLINAALKGIAVQVLLDGYASRNLDSTLIDKMRNSGIKLRFFEPVFKSSKFYFGRRLHHKVMVCDGSTALVSGINISDRYNDFPGAPGWLDWAVKIEGEAAFELHKICNELFAKKESDRINIDTKKIITEIYQEAECAIRIRRNDWVKNLNQISATYMGMMKNAQSEIILMSSYFIPNAFFRHQMQQAIKRGVKIRLILAGRSDVGISKYAERYLYQWALRNKVEIYEYNHNILHGKIAVCDGSRTTIGSYNVNDISAKASVELNVEIENKEFGDQVTKTLNKIISENCSQVSTAQNKRNLTEKFIQWISYEIYKSIFTLFTFYFKKEKR